jgi:hypothetical protein
VWRIIPNFGKLPVERFGPFPKRESIKSGVLHHSQIRKACGRAFWTVPERGKLQIERFASFPKGESFMMSVLDHSQIVKASDREFCTIHKL